MRLDAHVHFWRYNETDYAWITENMNVIRRDFLPEDWMKTAEPLGFDGLIAVQARQTLLETGWLLELADKYPVIRGVVGWLDLRNPALGDHLEILCDHPRFVAARHVVQDEDDPRFMLQDEFLRGIGKLAKCDLAYDILIYAPQLPAATELVGHFPQQTFVLNHIGKPDIRSGEFEPWATELHRIAAHDNVYCKLSGMVTEADWESWTPKQLQHYLDVVFDAFEPERLMIGADWPACLVAATYEQTVAVVMSYLHGMPEDVQSGILGANCARAYGIEDGDR